ncbi:DUF3108 domain-containing protein [Azospirillum doebereinerae]
MAAALAGLLSAQPGTVSAAPVSATYRVHVGGVAVLDVAATLEMTDSRYRMEVTAQTDGFLGRMFPWRTVSRSEGAVRPDRLLPTRHSQSSVFREKPRSVTLEYDGQGNVAATVLPPPEEDDREPVPDALKRGTYDPLSGFLAVLAAAARGEACTRSLPVYDGRRRYDMILEDVGQRLVAASRYSIFAGAARQCRVSYRPVAGYGKNPPSGAFWRRDNGPSERPPADLWLAPVVPGELPLPVRLETESDFGAVVIHLTSVVPSGVTPPGGTPATPAPR